MATPCTRPTVRAMTRKGKWFYTVALIALLALGTGCGGIHAHKSISILDFFLPGLTKNDELAKPGGLDNCADGRRDLAAQ